MSSEPEAVERSARLRGTITVNTQADHEARNPYFRWLMHLGLPLIVSIAVHLTLLIATMFVTFQVLSSPAIEVGDYEAGIRDLDVAGNFSFDVEEALDTPPQDLESLDDLRLTDITPTDLAMDTPADIGETGGDFGLGSGDGGGILGLGGGAGEAGSGGFGSGLGSRMRIGQAGVWNLNVAANHIVYVVDFSGSIVTVVDDLKRELKLSIGRLKKSQTFNVILFYGKGRALTDSFESQLVPATEENRLRFVEWIDAKGAEGGTNPLPAVQRALSQGPEAVFFFSDGLFEDDLVERITSANRNVNAQFVCLLFDDQVFEDPSGLPPGVDEQAQRLKRLAERNLGRSTKAAFKIVTLKDLYGG
ncbi:MAG: hypothetical protein JXO22_12805 [Phycisphaerae bacterium]|nr:hypothetical protein [Phycisphaerae bacterium]